MGLQGFESNIYVTFNSTDVLWKGTGHWALCTPPSGRHCRYAATGHFALRHPGGTAATRPLGTRAIHSESSPRLVVGLPELP